MHVTRRVSCIVLASLALVVSASLAACSSDSSTDEPATTGGAGTGGSTGGSSSSAGGHGGTAGASAAGHAGVSGHGGSGAGVGGASGHGGGSAGAAGQGGGSAGKGGNAGASGGQGGATGGHGGTPGGGKGGTPGAGGDAGTGGTPGAGGNGGTPGAGGDGGTPGTGGTGAGGTGAGGDAGGQGGSGTASSFPTKPISYMKEKPFTVDSGTTNWVYVPASYDDTHMTPTTLLVWLHGCGGVASGDVWVVSPGGSQSWITLAVGGQEGKCWDVDKDPARVLAALADIKTHFNIKPKGVVLGGYSSGGDLTYRTAFYNADLFAGVIVENSSPYRDTGSKEAASLAAASWKFNTVHLAHLQDTTYPIAGVQKETDSMKAAGFPIQRIEVDGGHYDDAGAIENGHAVPGTDADLVKYLLPNLDKGWMAP